MPGRVKRGSTDPQRPAYLPPQVRKPRPALFGRRGLLGLALVLVLVAAGFGGWRLYNSSWLTIQRVTVAGASAVSEDSVREAAGIEGQRFFAVDTAAAVAHVKALAWVKDAAVARRFPDSATITVVERTPIGVWRVGADSYLVDGEGKVLDAGAGPGNLPVVDATRSGVDVQAGDRVDADALRVAGQAAISAPNMPGQAIVRFVYDKDSGLTAVTESGAQVRLGDGQNLDYKLAVWQALVRKVNPSEIHELDLRYGDRPFYR